MTALSGRKVEAAVEWKSIDPSHSFPTTVAVRRRCGVKSTHEETGPVEATMIWPAIIFTKLPSDILSRNVLFWGGRVAELRGFNLPRMNIAEPSKGRTQRFMPDRPRGTDL